VFPVATLARELDPLRLTPGQRGRGLAKRDVPQPDVVQRAELAPDFWQSAEKLECLLDRHVEHVGDRLPLVVDLQRFAVVPLATTLLTRHINVGQKVHLDLKQTVSAARLASSSGHVEREPALRVAAHLGLRQLGEDLADGRKDTGVRRGVRAWSSSNRRLIDRDDLVEMLDPLQPIEGPQPLL
jgi:hypothetical protein